ncbi:hypothetical protein A9Q81_16255 [Gammaproteobacteria bacterium 42_54_T18]|nr:hypothetical protein A9Q81_16255 [Gammaproteobacteria bacterium 42_54_T18]
MNIDLSLMPVTLDVAHVGLGALSLLLIIIVVIMAMFRSSSNTNESTVEPNKEQVTPSDKVDESAIKQNLLKETTPEAALQLLMLLQQDARLIDFVHEDLAGFSDSDVGAAARVVHEGSRKVLQQVFNFEAIRSEDEESRITLVQGFNASENRLTGNVTGEAPFTGTLIHKGWRVNEVSLPQLAKEHDVYVVAPAEVEL